MRCHEFLGEMIRRNPLRSQREACRVAARRSIAALGPAKTEDEIGDAVLGLADGLFNGATAEQLAMMEEEYRNSLAGR